MNAPREIFTPQITGSERAQHDIILFQAFFSFSSCLKSPMPGQWEGAFRMLATQGYGKESVLLILLLLYEYANIIFRNCYILHSSPAGLNRTMLCSCP